MRTNHDGAAAAEAGSEKCTPYDAAVGLSRFFLYMAAWRMPEYESLPDDERELFTDLVLTGKLFAAVEDEKRLCLNRGVPLRGE